MYKRLKYIDILLITCVYVLDNGQTITILYTNELHIEYGGFDVVVVFCCLLLYSLFPRSRQSNSIHKHVVV